jgi:hypothetical protein
MFRRNHLTLLAATLAAALAACATSTPMTSVGAPSYPAAQGHAGGQASDRLAAGTPRAQPSAPAVSSTNDPMHRLDMP